MGRFDALTRLEGEKEDTGNNPSFPVNPEQPTESHRFTSLLANQQNSKLVNEQTNKSVKLQTSKETNQQGSKEVNQQTSKLPLSTKEKKKYGTYLRVDSILNINVRAAQEQKKDHELMQEIVDFYFENHEN